MTAGTVVSIIAKGSVGRYLKTKLKRGKKYSFKIKAYKKVDKKVYGSFSKAKSKEL